VSVLKQENERFFAEWMESGAGLDVSYISGN